MGRNRRLGRLALAAVIFILLSALAIGAFYACGARERESGQEAEEQEPHGEQDGETGEEQEEQGEPPADGGEKPNETPDTETTGTDTSTQEVWNPQETIPGELPEVWDYVEEDETMVTLHNKEILVGGLPEEAVTGLEAELLEFLKGSGEFRRELEVKQDSVRVTPEEVTLELLFCTERMDGQTILSVFDADGWHFAPGGGTEPETGRKTSGQETPQAEAAEGKGVEE